MRNYLLFFLLLLIICSCSSKKQIVYINDYQNSVDWDFLSINFPQNYIQIGDVLKIEVKSKSDAAAFIYNRTQSLKNVSASLPTLLELDGYMVNDRNEINFPVIGSVSTDKLTPFDLSEKIKNLLISDNHLNDASVTVRVLNSRFTILGEVRNPGTFTNYNNSLNIFQAIGFAGDLTIDGRREGITIIRDNCGKREVLKINLTSTNILSHPAYFIKTNDVIIVNPTFNKVKSAGFIGSASSIASIASILLSLTLLIINK